MAQESDNESPGLLSEPSVNKDSEAIKISLETCVDIPEADPKAAPRPSRRWVVKAVVALLALAAIGFASALAVRVLTDHASPSPSAAPATPASSLSSDGGALLVDPVIEDSTKDSNAGAEANGVSQGYIASSFSIGTMGEETLNECSPGLIPWNTPGKNPDWYIASKARCTTLSSDGALLLSPGVEIGDQIGCADDGPMPCPTAYDGSLEACLEIAMLSVFGQSYELRFYDGDWVTWNDVSQECTIFDRDSLCDELAEGDSHDYSFQYCGEGYVKSHHTEGDAPDETCKQGTLEYAENPWFVAQGMICTASDDGAVEVFAAGQIIEGCNPEDHCSPTYDGTMSGCHHLAVDAMSGLNSKLAELHVGDWMSYNQETGECSLWQTCGKLSPSPASSSFQYCGVSHKVAGEAYDYDYYGSYGYDDAGYDYDNYGYDYGSSMDEEGQD